MRIQKIPVFTVSKKRQIWLDSRRDLIKEIAQECFSLTEEQAEKLVLETKDEGKNISLSIHFPGTVPQESYTAFSQAVDETPGTRGHETFEASMTIPGDFQFTEQNKSQLLEVLHNALEMNSEDSIELEISETDQGANLLFQIPTCYRDESLLEDLKQNEDFKKLFESQELSMMEIKPRAAQIETHLDACGNIFIRNKETEGSDLRQITLFSIEESSAEIPRLEAMKEKLGELARNCFRIPEDDPDLAVESYSEDDKIKVRLICSSKFLSKTKYDRYKNMVLRMVPGIRSFDTFNATLLLNTDLATARQHYNELMLIMKNILEMDEEDFLTLELLKIDDFVVKLHFKIPKFYFVRTILKDFLEEVFTDPKLKKIFNPAFIDFEMAHDSIKKLDLQQKLDGCYALLVGCCYSGRGELKGPDDDVKNVINFLQNLFEINFKKLFIGYDLQMEDPWEYFGLKETENFTRENVTFFKSTKENIKSYFTKVISLQSKDKDSFAWVHFSGHGIQLDDDFNSSEPSEADNMDEAIAPSDFRKNGYIRDDFLKDVVHKYHENGDGRLIAVFDCCHSGSMLDLKKGDENCRVMSFSGCRDNQTSADLSRGRTEFGAMTTAFIGVIVDNILNDVNPLELDSSSIGALINNQFIRMRLNQRNETRHSKQSSGALGNIMYSEEHRNFEPISLNVDPLNSRKFEKKGSIRGVLDIEGEHYSEDLHLQTNKAEQNPTEEKERQKPTKTRIVRTSDVHLLSVPSFYEIELDERMAEIQKIAVDCLNIPESDEDVSMKIEPKQDGKILELFLVCPDEYLELISAEKVSEEIKNIQSMPRIRAFNSFATKLKISSKDLDLMQAFKHDFIEAMKEVAGFEENDDDFLNLEITKKKLKDNVLLHFTLPRHCHRETIMKDYDTFIKHDLRFQAIFNPGFVDQTKAEQAIQKFGFAFDETTNDCYALFVGCNYENSKAPIEGTEDDVAVSVKLLQSLQVKFKKLYIGCDDSKITEALAWDYFDLKEQPGFRKKDFIFFDPTKENIENYYKQIINESATDGKSFCWIQLSGHGCFPGTTEEGFVPRDFEDFENGEDAVIRDEFLKQAIENQRGYEQNIIAVFDCLHSQTMLDLQTILDPGCNVIALSGCKDEMLERSEFGAFTKSLMTVLSENTVKGCNPLEIHLNSLQEFLKNQVIKMNWSQKIAITPSKEKIQTLGNIMYKRVSAFKHEANQIECYKLTAEDVQADLNRIVPDVILDDESEKTTKNLEILLPSLKIDGVDLTLNDYELTHQKTWTGFWKCYCDENRDLSLLQHSLKLCSKEIQDDAYKKLENYYEKLKREDNFKMLWYKYRFDDDDWLDTAEMSALLLDALKVYVDSFAKMEVSRVWMEHEPSDEGFLDKKQRFEEFYDLNAPSVQAAVINSLRTFVKIRIGGSCKMNEVGSVWAEDFEEQIVDTIFSLANWFGRNLILQAEDLFNKDHAKEMICPRFDPDWMKEATPENQRKVCNYYWARIEDNLEEIHMAQKALRKVKHHEREDILTSLINTQLRLTKRTSTQVWKIFKSKTGDKMQFQTWLRCLATLMTTWLQNSPLKSANLWQILNNKTYEERDMYLEAYLRTQNENCTETLLEYAKKFMQLHRRKRITFDKQASHPVKQELFYRMLCLDLKNFCLELDQACESAAELACDTMVQELLENQVEDTEELLKQFEMPEEEMEGI